jgi:hypothetical protein
MAEVETTTRRNLTDKFIQSLKPTDKRVTYWDATEPGLGIVVQPAAIGRSSSSGASAAASRSSTSSSRNIR